MIDLHTLDRFRITNPEALVHTDGWAGDEDHGSFTIQSRRSMAR